MNPASIRAVTSVAINSKLRVSRLCLPRSRPPMARRKPEHQIDVYVPAGETRVAICVFVHRLNVLETVRIQGLSHARLQQTQLDTVFVVPRPRKPRKSADG